VGLAQALEQAAVQALLSSSRVLDERGELMVVPYKAEGVCPHDRAQHSGQRDLPGLVYDACIKEPAMQQRMRCAEARASNLQWQN